MSERQVFFAPSSGEELSELLLPKIGVTDEEIKSLHDAGRLVSIEGRISVDSIMEYLVKDEDPERDQETLLRRAYKNGFISVWGTKTWKAKRRKPFWYYLNPGDYVFYNEGRLTYVTKTILKFESDKLAEGIWGRDESDGKTWRLLMFLQVVDFKNTPWIDFCRNVGYDPFVVQQFVRASSEKTTEILQFLESKKIEPKNEIVIKEPQAKISLDPIEKITLAHLIAGKNVIIYGSPGTGKTRAAKRICEHVCGTNGFLVETANAELGFSDVVIGYQPSTVGPRMTPGFLTRAVKACADRKRNGRPYWLIVDEINRANLDLAFGRVLTLLDIDYRQQQSLLDADTNNALSGENKSLFVPLNFRIIATMNTYDRSLLFALGFAFMRRFAFVSKPSMIPIRNIDSPQITEGNQRDILSAISWTLSTDGEQLLRDTILTALEQYFRSLDEFGFASFSKEVDSDLIERTLMTLQDRKVTHFDSNLNVFQILECLSKLLGDLGIADIGQALLIDGSKFVVTYASFHVSDLSETNLASILDEAVLAYILPQIEFFMPKLRREVTFGEETVHKTSWNTLKLFAYRIGLSRSLNRLVEAEETARLI